MSAAELCVAPFISDDKVAAPAGDSAVEVIAPLGTEEDGTAADAAGTGVGEEDSGLLIGG